MSSSFPDHEDLRRFRAGVVRFWERRRWIYLALMIPSCLVGYLIPAGIAAGVGDPPKISGFEVLLMFAFGFVGSNICYSLAYAIEFLAMATRFHATLANRRTGIFVGGCILGILFAFVWAQAIAFARYPN